MSAAGRMFCAGVCALFLAACGGGGGGSGGSNNGGNNNPPGGSNTPSYSISASQSTLSVQAFAGQFIAPYIRTSQSITVTYTGPTITVTSAPEWLMIIAPSISPTSPATYRIETPFRSVAIGDYTGTIQFRTADADGSNAVTTEVTVSMSVQAGHQLFAMPEGLAAGRSLSVKVNDNEPRAVSQHMSPLPLIPDTGTFMATVIRQPENQRCIFQNGELTIEHERFPTSPTYVYVYCHATLIPWTWMGGSRTPGTTAVHGTRGIASSVTTPGAREPGAYAADANGNLWLFGGVSEAGIRNDLWRYDISAGTWMWVSGSSDVDAPGVYGTRSVPSSNNVPGARSGAVAWVDDNGDFWLFGGEGNATVAGAPGLLKEVWKYDVSADVWTWMSGDYAAWGTYSTTPSVDNIPGARAEASVVQDSQGGVWIFGGRGYGGRESYGHMNDLWRFTPANGEWQWIGGDDAPVSASVYGTQGVPDAGNYPDGRTGAALWIGSDGNVWMFGGVASSIHRRGDLWRYDTGANRWTWVSGSDDLDWPRGQYSTPGTSTTDIPAGRAGAATWIDAAGNLWMLGGDAGNDLWKYSPAANAWSWLSGGRDSRSASVFGTLGESSNINVPSSRWRAASWRDPSGRFWVFGGGNYSIHVDDVWRVEPQ